MQKNWKKLHFFHQAFTILNYLVTCIKQPIESHDKWLSAHLYRLNATWETIHLRFLLTVVSLLSIAQYSPKSTRFQPFHVMKVGNFRTEKQQAGVRVLINRQHFKTGVLEIPIRESLLSNITLSPPIRSLLYAIPPSLPPPPLSLHSGASYYNESPSLSGTLVTRR